MGVKHRQQLFSMSEPADNLSRLNHIHALPTRFGALLPLLPSARMLRRRAGPIAVRV